MEASLNLRVCLQQYRNFSCFILGPREHVAKQLKPKLARHSDGAKGENPNQNGLMRFLF